MLLAIHHLFMLAQIRPKCKRLVTLAALERLVVGVSLHMCSEIGPENISFCKTFFLESLKKVTSYKLR